MNLRHGNGVFKTGGKEPITYHGQWVNDIKHGKGKLTYANGEQILGTWENDRLNGICRVLKPGKTEWSEVIYKDDMLIMNNDMGLTCMEKVHLLFGITLCAIFYCAIPLGLVVQKEMFYIMLIYIVYIIHGCCQDATWYIWNLKSL